MKLIQWILPDRHEIERRRLEAQLEAETRRLNEATQRAADKFRFHVIEKNFPRERPLETAIALMLGGYFLARWVHEMQEHKQARKMPGSRRL